jgi:PAS domain S-box-containing protein
VARYEAILASTQDPVLTVDGHGTIQAASDSVHRVFGWTPEELIGRSVNVLMPEPHRSRHDQYLADFRRTGESTILGRTREFEAIRKDGTHLPIELSVSRVDLPEGETPLFTGIIRDITGRKRVELALQESERRFREILEEVGLAAVMIDTEGGVTFCNDYLLHLTGWKRKEVLGHNWFRMILPPDEGPQALEAFKAGVAQGAILMHLEDRIQTRHGELRIIAWSNTVLRGRGESSASRASARTSRSSGGPRRSSASTASISRSSWRSAPESSRRRTSSCVWPTGWPRSERSPRASATT